MNKKCNQVALYFYNEMDPVEKKSFEEHLNQCPFCQKELLFLKQTQSALTPSAAPADLVEAVLKKNQPVRFWHKMFKPALAFATIMAVGVCLLLKGPNADYQVNAPTVDWTSYLAMQTDTQYNDFVEDFEVFESEF